ncbi:hypothetical protein M378DRAFT_170130 [Amanita muscaria Koide BX008]|uniref:Uncharacterized protein n=1 Tax=Amanita muscaria (strain Koide BX008) TaxID=946122 RepID=A0A0C2S7U2_AMAMK|nr:hypothetical protein M378DRAFT_170130 [Amanita muscaria Koide BX008]
MKPLSQCCKVRPSLNPSLRRVRVSCPSLAFFQALLSDELISDNFSISSLSITLTPLYPSKHISCLRCYGFANRKYQQLDSRRGAGISTLLSLSELELTQTRRQGKVKYRAAFPGWSNTSGQAILWQKN